MRRFSTAVTITDPLVKYQTLVAAGTYAPDPAQHRLARHLHKVYLRIKDYSPQIEYRQRLEQIVKLTSASPPNRVEDESALARSSHSIWRNPLFKHLLSNPEGKESRALTRVLTNQETAMEIDSPKGLFLSGEVGTGKSMLLDLLAEGLPTERKKRWHFNTFMLYTFATLESHRKSHHASVSIEDGNVEYSLLWMAKKLVDESPILFLDEFQLPDRAASKLLSHLFIGFFQLGGVLIASSNRMPEELQKATGVDYTPAPSRGLIRNIFGGAEGRRQSGGLFGSSSDFATFLEVLKARCDFWQMEGAQDWRRIEEADSPEVARTTGAGLSTLESSLTDSQETTSERIKKPFTYFLLDDDTESWSEMIKKLVARSSTKSPDEPILWEPSTLVVYGRHVRTPRHFNGIVMWDFNDLVESFGPADYITMASSYHTFIIDNVPVLTVIKKNEARRFITLLDALYEARCKLVIRAQNPPDELFFPETKPRPSITNQPGASGEKLSEDSTYSETIAEVYQDQMSPFRPNVSYYDSQTATSQYDPDQDSDFGIVQKGQPSRHHVDFGNTGAFTGEDERFAYKRAASRLWELCSAQWHAREGDWWRPLPLEARHWERGEAAQPKKVEVNMEHRGHKGEGMGERVELEEVGGLSRWRVQDLRKNSEEDQK